jgi:hypothetical protein
MPISCSSCGALRPADEQGRTVFKDLAFRGAEAHIGGAYPRTGPQALGERGAKFAQGPLGAG